MDTQKDPVCGMSVKPETAKVQTSFAGITYYFCNVKCKTKFDANPKLFLGSPKSKPKPQEGFEYTCPMHLEIKQIGPGSCPICGMALEPSAPTLEAEDDSEYKTMLLRFQCGAIFSLP